MDSNIPLELGGIEFFDYEVGFCTKCHWYMLQEVLSLRVIFIFWHVFWVISCRIQWTNTLNMFSDPCIYFFESLLSFGFKLINGHVFGFNYQIFVFRWDFLHLERQNRRDMISSWLEKVERGFSSFWERNLRGHLSFSDQIWE
jgi:hypothetical protein